MGKPKKQAASSRWVTRGVAAQRLGIAEYTLRTCKEYKSLPGSATRINEHGRSEVDYELLEAAWGATHPQDDSDIDNDEGRDKWLRRCHKIKGDLLQIELDLRRGTMVDVNEMERRISTLAALLRQGAQRINVEFGEKAASIIEEVLFDWQQQMEKWQPEEPAE